MMKKKTVTSCKTNKPSEQICGYFNAEFPLYKTRLYRCKERNLFSLNPKYLLTSRFNFFMTFAFLIVSQKHSCII